MSKYDTIKTARDLITEVIMHGLSTDQEDRNRAADIFGRSTVDELDRLANGIIIKEEPHDTITEHRDKIQTTFYFIAFSIWHWEDATRFFNNHTNPLFKEAKEDKRKLAEMTWQANETKESLRQAYRRINELNDKVNNYMAMERDLEATKQENVSLKAKLYDLMTAGA